MVCEGRMDGQMDGRTDRQKKWHTEVGAPPKKLTNNKLFKNHAE